MLNEKQHFEEPVQDSEPHSRKEAEWIKKEHEVGQIPNLEAGTKKIVTALNRCI